MPKRQAVTIDPNRVDVDNDFKTTVLMPAGARGGEAAVEWDAEAGALVLRVPVLERVAAPPYVQSLIVYPAGMSIAPEATYGAEYVGAARVPGAADDGGDQEVHVFLCNAIPWPPFAPTMCH